jgi:hypothetical protein
MPVSTSVQKDLQDAYLSKNLIVFVGAGVPASAGLDDWPALAKRLLERLRSEGKSVEMIAEIQKLIEKNQLIDALTATKNGLGTHEFNRVVENALDDKGKDIPDLAIAIAELKPELKAVITTNLDRFMERAFGGEWPSLVTPTGDLARRKHYILKLHGTLLDRSSWVFTRDQYDHATFGQPLVRKIFETVFSAFPLLFVGYGLVDDDFEQTLSATRVLAGNQPPQHFALLRGPLAPYRRQKLEQSGVRLLEYDDHSDVPKLLRAIRQ